MATLNLGRIKPVFRGAYNSSTSYVVDDIVTTGGETFICILASTGNATSNSTYWTKLAEKGTDGTDVGTTLTTQGDILYRDASGLQRLGAGTSGQFLKTQGTGANPVWDTASSEAGKFSFHAYNSSNVSASASTNTEAVLPNEHHDADSKYDTSNGRYTPGETGKYYVSCAITMNDINGAGDMLYVKFRVNGNSSTEWGHVRQGGASGSAYRVVTTSAVVNLTNTSDYISVWYYQTAGANRFLIGEMCHFEGFKIA